MASFFLKHDKIPSIFMLKIIIRLNFYLEANFFDQLENLTLRHIYDPNNYKRDFSTKALKSLS